MNVLGIHHVTAISAEIVRNLEFYTGVLGMRLVKKSINQDDVSAYHLFYADKNGSPGTDLTFFDWPFAASNRPGAGTIALTSLRILRSSFDFWEARLRDSHTHVERQPDRLEFSDPEGQALAFVADDDLPGEVEPWTPVIPEEHAYRGILGVDINSVNYDASAAVLTQLLGFAEIESGLFEVQTESSVGQIRLFNAGASLRARPGAGGVHHVAFRARDDEHLYALQNRIEEMGLQTSGYVDRHWFHSLYFREPGGVLFEIATDGPGMAHDESPEHLGETLSIPPFLEHRRAEIEAGLKPLPGPAYLTSEQG